MARLFVEQLTVIDCSILDAQRGLVGESWIVDLELEGDLDAQGMVLDFGDVKKRLRKAVDDVADHKLLVPGASPLLHLVRSGERTGLTFKAATGVIEHQGPVQSICVVDGPAVTGDALAAQLQAAVLKVVPRNVRSIALSLRHEDIAGAYYHYTHGLRKHAGHCQRIAHGHRSRIEIWVDGKRDARLEHRWADIWRDIYIGTSADVVAHGKGRVRFEYKSSEGEFLLELPAERCDLLPTDSTVECIAEHIAWRVAEERAGARVQVRAYEGVMKGAIAVLG